MPSSGDGLGSTGFDGAALSALGHESRGAVRALMDAYAWPLGPAASCYLEWRPAQPDRVDVLMAVSRGRRQLFRDWLGTDTAAVRSDLSRMSEAWNRGEQGPLANVSALWLEYDAVHMKSVDEQPSVSACLIDGYRGDVRPRGAGLSPEAVRGMLELLSMRPLSRGEHTTLTHLLSILPSDGALIHVSAMCGRPDAPLKLYCMVPRREVSAFLRRAGVADGGADVCSLLDVFCPEHRVHDQIFLDLTVLSTARIGISLAPQHLHASDERDPRRRAFLELCSTRGLCTDEQSEAMQRWPTRALAEQTLAGRPALWMTERWLDLKLVWTETAPLELKAYLGVRQRPANAFDRARD